MRRLTSGAILIPLVDKMPRSQNQTLYVAISDPEKIADLLQAEHNHLEEQTKTFLQLIRKSRSYGNFQVRVAAIAKTVELLQKLCGDQVPVAMAESNQEKAKLLESHEIESE